MADGRVLRAAWHGYTSLGPSLTPTSAISSLTSHKHRHILTFSNIKGCLLKISLQFSEQRLLILRFVTYSLPGIYTIWPMSFK